MELQHHHYLFSKDDTELEICARSCVGEVTMWIKRRSPSGQWIDDVADLVSSWREQGWEVELIDA